MTTLAFTTLRGHSLFAQPLQKKSVVIEAAPIDVLSQPAQLTNGTETADLAGMSVSDIKELSRAFDSIAAILRTLEIDVSLIDSCLEKLMPAQREKILTHLQQLKRNKQKTHDLHYHYTETCLAASQQHFTNGVTPRERQLAERIMKLREHIAGLITLCHNLLTKYKLIGKLQLPKDCGKSLAAIKQLGNILTSALGGTFKYQANGFKIINGQEIYIDRSGEVYAGNDIEQLQNALVQIAQAIDGKPLVQTSKPILVHNNYQQVS